MLTGFETELAKLLARELYKYAKQAGKETHRALKDTSLTKRGGGLPEAILSTFESSFRQTLNGKKFFRDGYAKWRHDGSDREFGFLFCKPLIREINKSDWVTAAKGTAEGVKQIDALGGDEKYQAAVRAAIMPTFTYAVSKACGKMYGSGDYRWSILTPVLTPSVAKEGTADFKPKQLFYWSWGTEEATQADYKLAKTLITGRFLRSPSPPSIGPFAI